MASEPTTPTPDREALLPPELREPLEAWAFNVMLECSGSAEEHCEIMMGGAFLDLRDLNRILDWARALAGDRP